MPTPYSADFYRLQRESTAESAKIIVPRVLQLFPSSSVVDVGCGIGTWLKSFEENGIVDYVGIDGDYVPRGQMEIAPDKFRSADLTAPISFERRFDLACSLEVAEHLPESSAKAFVAALVQAAPVVLFSAAIPLQGGASHVNERWQEYWASLFAAHGYVAVDCVRPGVWGDERVAWWYRQNILIFCPPEKCPAGHSPALSAYELNRVDPAMLESLVHPSSGIEAMKMVRTALPVLARGLTRRLGQHVWNSGSRRSTGA